MTGQPPLSIAHPRALLQALYCAAVQRALPMHTTAPHLPPPPQGRTWVLGAGKAAAAMAQALEALWPADAPLAGLVVTRYGHTPPRPPGLVQRIEVTEAAHPVPDTAGVAAAERILALARQAGPDDLVLCLMSGGGSALLTLPCDGLTLADKQRINRELLASGADIAQMNTVRKHLSRIKGGRLAAACAPAPVVTLAISDVPGDDPGVIASGPTVPDASTCADALAVLHRHRIAVPAAVQAALQSGALETPKPGAAAAHPASAFHLIATPQMALQAAADAARQAGLNAYILSDAIEGESREVGKVHAALARAVPTRAQGHCTAATSVTGANPPGPTTPALHQCGCNGHGNSNGRSETDPGADRCFGYVAFQRPCVLLSGGETTVTLRPPPSGPTGALPPQGRGGRAGEFALGLAQALQGAPGVWALAADTDGIDGVQDNAGAFVTPDTLARAQALGLSVDAHLAHNDSYGFFSALGDLLVTGPTHTNVNDFRAVVVL